MKAAIYFGPGDIRCTKIPDPELKDDHEVLVKVIATSICGSDLHLYRGALDGVMERGKSQTGHELIGEVVQAGKDIGRLKIGDRISMAYSASCGQCYCCRVGQTAHCETTQKAVYGFGVAFGNLNGTHAEALVLPHADTHAIKVPEAIEDTAALTLSCNLPTAIIANRLANVQAGESVAIVGCGPTGMMCLDLAMRKGAAVVAGLERVPHRLDTVRNRGAIAIDTERAGEWKELALEQTNGRGFDKIIEVVGSSEALQICLELVRPGGTVAAMGVFTDSSFNLNLADVFLRNISLHMNGFASVQPVMWDAVRLIEHGVIDARAYFSHSYSLDEIDLAFSSFNKKIDGMQKVVITP